ncbi:dihydrodipicolinate synthase family protein [Hoeflea olei]|uniref:Dihydrodipicolinate synthase family protein n=1 Tax=Hoeflea olei TaxID=1480615 RepID=A0A1C1YST2_9HYPH|nr:dihydrodipicolinate synthase family protein [Hoeflea olei]OCW56506.1 dihydrodipicolinate synthase family protein [Hoeflea olei]
MTKPIENILPVAPTPFHPDGRVDEEGMRRVIDCMIDQGVDAICILANYSEQFLLSDEERTLLMRLSLEHAAGRVPVIVTTSHFSTQVATARAKLAQSMGAAMIMMMPPYHGSGLFPAPQGIFEHFQAVNDAISIPIMVQDAPLSGVTMTVDLLARLARELENVSYFKIECPFAADKLAALIEAAGEHIKGPFDGEEAVTLLADLDAGATGTMTSALFPEKIRPIVASYRAGDTAAALAQWQKCLPLINHENRQCGLRAAKVVFKEGGVIASDHVRHPLKPMTERTRERLLQLARELDVMALSWGK